LSQNGQAQVSIGVGPEDYRVAANELALKNVQLQAALNAAIRQLAEKEQPAGQEDEELALRGSGAA
jgi:hypothetical protein